MEVYFVDVAQGTCQVILIGQSKAIVIDTGRRSRELVQLLDRLQISEIEYLIVSHLDADHSQGAAALLTTFRGRIGMVLYPDDRGRAHASHFVKSLINEIKGDHLSVDQVRRLECDGRTALLWESPASDAKLKILSPDFMQNQLAKIKNSPNSTSGILVLEAGTKSIVFPGDSSLDQWKQIHNRRQQPLSCDAIAVPHHAGAIWDSKCSQATIEQEMKWLYTQCIQPKHAIVSVGSSNSEEHPRREVIQALRNAQAIVLCTQMTSGCCNDLETIRPGLISLQLPGRSTDKPQKTEAGKSKDVGCAGTILVQISPTKFNIVKLTAHQNAVKSLAQDGHTPICL